jgi:Uma2 family endonuclease
MASSSSSMIDYWRLAMVPGPGLMTVEEYFAYTPYTLKPMELIHGAVRIADAPKPRHQSAVAELFRALDAHVRARRLGKMWLSPLDVVLSERDRLIVQPDLFFISTARAWIVDERVRGAPDLVIEVLSPNPRIGRTSERVAWFEQYGSRECWLVHEDHRTITVITFENHRQASRQTFPRREPVVSSVLPEFTLSLDEILED